MRHSYRRSRRVKPSGCVNRVARVKVLVVGSGGREHALAWKLRQSPRLSELHAAPGNPGIAALGMCHPVRPEDADGLLALARQLEVELVVIGPEAPLVAGVADELRKGGDAFVVEELLEGEEVSLLAICDGSRALPLPPAQDFKRAYDGDAGPNTGGMGAYSPVAGYDAYEAAELAAAIHERVLAELARRDAPFVGLLYA